MTFETLGGVLTPGAVLTFECAGCGHGAAWPAARAIRRFGAFAPPYDVRNRARCGACGGRRVRVFVQPAP
jgi:hypothetical protein